MKCFNCDSSKVYYCVEYRPNMIEKFKYTCKECDSKPFIGHMYNEGYAEDNPEEWKETLRIQKIYKKKYGETKNEKGLSYEAYLWCTAKDELFFTEDTYDYLTFSHHFDRVDSKTLGKSKI